MEQEMIIIIGAGPSGLAAAKYAKQEKLKFIVFQKFGDLGGVWNPKDGLVWKNMHTNISKYSCKFTDFDWPFQSAIFPTNQEFNRYLHEYAQHFQIIENIVFNAEVKSLCKMCEEKDLYKIVVDVKGEVQQYVVPHVVIASGLFSSEYMPKNIKGLDSFKGEIHHSRNYKGNENFEDKKVLVVGGSFTAVQLASDISSISATVHHSFRSPFFVFPHFITTQQKTKVPIDLLFYKRKEKEEPLLLTQELIRAKNQAYISACQQQQEIPSLKVKPEDLSKPLCINISSGYIKNTKLGKIIPHRSSIKQFTQKSVILQNGDITEEIEIDTVVFCTGCYPSISYLSQEIQETIRHVPWVQKHPTVMYKAVLHPDLKGLYFCGIYRGILIPICEMQAKFAIYMISGRGRYPSEEQFKEDIEIETRYHELKDIPQSRYSVYPAYCDQLATQLDFPKNLADLRKEYPEKYEKFMKLPLIQQKNTLTTIDIDIQIQNIEKALEECTLPL